MKAIKHLCKDRSSRVHDSEGGYMMKDLCGNDSGSKNLRAGSSRGYLVLGIYKDSA